MSRLVVVLLSVLIVLVTANGVLVWRADERAREDAERAQCYEKAEATAVIALLAPASTVSKEGRLQAIDTLGSRIDAC